MKKPWLEFERGRQLEAFIGVWGIKTRGFATSEELIENVAKLYQILVTSKSTVDDVAAQVEALGKKERRFLAMKNLGMFPDRGRDNASESPITQEALVEGLGKETPQLVSGASQDCVGELDIDPVRLLRKVVSAVIGAGQGHVLYEFPELLEFLGSRIPHPSELEGHHGVDTRMFEAKSKWPNLKEGWVDGAA